MVPKGIFVNLPADTTQFVEHIILPIKGTLSEYPFDRYPFKLGMTVERVENGRLRILEPGRDEVYFSVTFDENMPGMQITEPVILDPKMESSARDADHQYLIAFSATLNRPFYMQVFVGMLFIIFVCATIYTILNIELEKIILSIGAITLGLWATRAVVLGPIPAHVTFIDMALGVLVVFIALSIGVQASNHYLKALKGDGQAKQVESEGKTSKSVL